MDRGTDKDTDKSIGRGTDREMDSRSEGQIAALIEAWVKI